MEKETLTSLIGKFKKNDADYSEMTERLKRDALELMRIILKKYNNEITFDNDLRDSLESDMGSLSISYDGGNHPEYASNCFSTVYGLTLDNTGEINVDIEETSDYSIDRVWSLEELSLLTYALIWYDENCGDYDNEGNYINENTPNDEEC